MYTQQPPITVDTAKAAFERYLNAQDHLTRLEKLHDPVVVRTRACPDLLDAYTSRDAALNHWTLLEDRLADLL